MTELALVSTLGPDRVGLVAAITGTLYEHGVNLRDVSFAALGQGARLTAVCELPDDITREDIAATLSALPDLAGAEVMVTPFSYDPQPGSLGRITHRVVVSGGDQPGLIARLSDIFTQFGANIVRMDAQSLPENGGGEPHVFYAIRFSVALAPERAAPCLASVANTAESLGLACAVQASES
jgi:glycine cleavage system transcriptional repressor